MAYARTIDEFFSRPTPFAGLLKELRSVCLDLGLEETWKWSIPVYVHTGKNIAGISAFSSYAGIWFYQGALLADRRGVLINAQEGKTVAMRQWRFQAGDVVDPDLVRSYILEAMQLVEDGREIKPVRGKPLIIPDILQAVLEADPGLNARFDQLSLSCQREYAGYVGEAKREETRQRRLEKIIPMILTGKGLNDQYK